MKWCILLAALLLQARLCSSEVEFGDVGSLLGGGNGKKDKDIVPARKQDIKYIKCDVCKKMAAESMRLSDEARSAVSHASKVRAPGRDPAWRQRGDRSQNLLSCTSYAIAAG